MTRPAVLVLLLTFLALAVATLWVPCSVWYGASGSGPLWIGVWKTFSQQGMTHWDPSYRVEWRLLGIEYTLILAVGGLLALALHLRSRRVGGDAA